jgi:hypothetical protein
MATVEDNLPDQMLPRIPLKVIHPFHLTGQVVVGKYRKHIGELPFAFGGLFSWSIMAKQEKLAGCSDSHSPSMAAIFMG